MSLTFNQSAPVSAVGVFVSIKQPQSAQKELFLPLLSSILASDLSKSIKTINPHLLERF